METARNELGKLITIPPGIITVEAISGTARQRVLRTLLADAERVSARTWLLPCRFEAGGPWAGVRDLFSGTVDQIRERNPELVRKHDYELVHVLPELKRTLSVERPSLTDIAPAGEKVRNYPADRALRLIHGLVELLDEWKGFEGSSAPWVMVCDDFDCVSHLSHRFFRELMRRRARKLRLTLVLAVSPGEAKTTGEDLAPELPHSAVHLDLSSEDDPAIDPGDATRKATELERRVGRDGIEIEAHVAELIRLWKLADRPRRVLHWTAQALRVFETLGFYQDALAYGNEALELQKRWSPDDSELHFRICSKLFFCYASLGDPKSAQQLVEQEVAGRSFRAKLRGLLCYSLAMLHSRYLPERDLSLGEKYLDEGLQELAKADLPPADYYFQHVFNRNGLAMIRYFQGRHEEAIELCHTGLEQLEEHLHPDQHRLHRSVLVYNMAQVYASIGSYGEAIRHFGAAMEMDPNYSEYYNDRGNLLMRLGRVEEAAEDYLAAIDLSPPYHEVWANLGQCYRRLGKMKQAIDAYSRALDLEPDRALAWLGRAQAHEAIGETTGALEDYSEGIRLEPDQWQAIASRAVILYEAGNLEAALADLDRAIEMAPEEADLYQNRAVALADLGRREDAVRDLVRYLELAPGAPDRSAIEDRIRMLSKVA